MKSIEKRLGKILLEAGVAADENDRRAQEIYDALVVLLNKEYRKVEGNFDFITLYDCESSADLADAMRSLIFELNTKSGSRWEVGLFIPFYAAMHDLLAKHMPEVKNAMRNDDGLYDAVDSFIRDRTDFGGTWYYPPVQSASISDDPMDDIEDTSDRLSQGPTLILWLE